MNENKSIPKRDQVPVEFTWNTGDLFADDTAWQTAFDAAKEIPAKIATYQGRLGNSAGTLLSWLNFNEEISEKLSPLYYYAHLNADVDTGNSFYQDLQSKIFSLLVTVNSASAFETPEILAIPEETVAEFYCQEPGLRKYTRYLDNIRRQAAHILSTPEETLLAQAGEVARAPEKINSLFMDADLKFPDATDSMGRNYPLTQGSYIPLMENNDRVLRKSAFMCFYHTFGSFRNSSAAHLDAQVRQLKFFSTARKYASNLEASLDRTEVPVSVYHNLITAVHENMGLLHRYMALRKRLMKLDELHMYDIYAPMISESHELISYEMAKEEILAALAPMGEEYVSLLREGFSHRWIDVYENEGKRSGAYSSGGKPHPYVLLNQKDTLDSEFTIAHEMGHALHTWYSTQNQPPVYSDYVIFVAEVASICNEALLMDYKLAHTQDKIRRASLINYFLEQFRTTLYRQTMFAEFEQQINAKVEQGESLTADLLCSMYLDLNRIYYGANVVCDEEIGMEWARIPHFYYNFYVFQYATGFSAAMALSQKILREGKSAVDAYRTFLSSGCSQSPIDLLKAAGVDMVTPEPVNAALKVFETLLTEMEKLAEAL